MKEQYRVALCKYTGRKVVQIQENAGSWLCLHNNHIEGEKEGNERLEILFDKKSRPAKRGRGGRGLLTGRESGRCFSYCDRSDCANSISYCKVFVVLNRVRRLSLIHI